MSSKKVWFITGAGRGMGADFVRAALGAGYSVVTSGRDADKVSKAFGKSNDLLAVKLDVTRLADAKRQNSPIRRQKNQHRAHRTGQGGVSVLP